MNRPTGRLATVDYRPPQTPGEVRLSIVTPTWNRVADLIEQAERIGGQLSLNDRWIIVDDASAQVPDWRKDIVPKLKAVDQIMIAALAYAKGDTTGTVNRARSIACNLADLDTWIVELDDHDFLEDGALDTIRQVIHQGAVFIYADTMTVAGGERRRFKKPDYVPFLLRDRTCPCEGVRAYPAWLYHKVADTDGADGWNRTGTNSQAVTSACSFGWNCSVKVRASIMWPRSCLNVGRFLDRSPHASARDSRKWPRPSGRRRRKDGWNVPGRIERGHVAGCVCCHHGHHHHRKEAMKMKWFWILWVIAALLIAAWNHITDFILSFLVPVVGP